MKCTQYFSFVRQRADRSLIKEEWITGTINNPMKTEFQSDGRIRKWGYIEEVGKYLIKNGIIIAHVAQGSYIAVSAACTHEGTNIEYKSAQNIFHCPNHDSEFKTDGSVQKGPAKKSLTQYNVTVNGNIIRIFS